jgi:predicted DNA-binding transcriptional regulator AlpA
MSKLSLNYTPRLFRLEPAAAYLGMGRTKFLELVERGKMPKPMHVDGMRLWDRQALDTAADDLATETTNDNGGGRPNSFDQVLGDAG